MAIVEEQWRGRAQMFRNMAKPAQVRVIVSYEDREIVLTGVIEQLTLSRETYDVASVNGWRESRPTGPTRLELTALINETVVDVEDETGEG